MERNKTMQKFIITIAVLTLVFLIGFYTGSHRVVKIDLDDVDKIDTSYNKVVLDSIQWNIIQKDSTIYHLNIKMKEDVDKSYLLNDDEAVKLFLELLKDKRDE